MGQPPILQPLGGNHETRFYLAANKVR
jgi:hypothetical protein